MSHLLSLSIINVTCCWLYSHIGTVPPGPTQHSCSLVLCLISQGVLHQTDKKQADHFFFQTERLSLPQVKPDTAHLQYLWLPSYHTCLCFQLCKEKFFCLIQTVFVVFIVSVSVAPAEETHQWLLYLHVHNDVRGAWYVDGTQNSQTNCSNRI